MAEISRVSGNRLAGLPLLPPDLQTVSIEALGGNAGSFLVSRQMAREFDSSTFTAEPLQVITADCSNPKEIDDGIHVEALPAAKELYRVSVCVADTSRLFDDPTIRTQAYERKEAKYWLRRDGSFGYRPMIDSAVIKDLELKEGEVESALVVSFTVGRHQPIDDVQVSFRPIEVTKNLDYRSFHKLCREKKAYQKYGRAGALIINHLGFTSGGDNRPMVRPRDNLGAIHNSLVNTPYQSVWASGARLNETFMIAAGHVVGGLLDATGYPAIYRLHDPGVAELGDVIPATNARFGLSPGPHVGLSLEPYCRMTSPLRRLEDFVMSYMLRKYAGNEAVTVEDRRLLETAVAGLNGRIADHVSATRAKQRLPNHTRALTYSLGSVWPGLTSESA